LINFNSTVGIWRCCCRCAWVVITCSSY